MWIGNHFGSSMISTGISGTARHERMPKSARRMRVKTLQAPAPPAASSASRALTMCGAAGSSPIIFSAK